MKYSPSATNPWNTARHGGISVWRILGLCLTEVACITVSFPPSPAASSHVPACLHFWSQAKDTSFLLFCQHCGSLLHPPFLCFLPIQLLYGDPIFPSSCPLLHVLGGGGMYGWSRQSVGLTGKNNHIFELPFITLCIHPGKGRTLKCPPSVVWEEKQMCKVHI